MSTSGASHPRFGALVRVGRASRFVGVLLIAAGLLPLGFGGMLAFITMLGDAVVLGLLLWLPLVFLGLYLGRTGYRYGWQALEVYEGGFVRQDGNKRIEAAWSEIDGIRRTSYERKGAILCDGCWVERRGQKPLVVVDMALSDFGEVGAALDRCSAAVLTPLWEEAIRSGRTLAFGPISMSQAGLHLKKHSVGWGEITSVSFERPTRELIQTADRYESDPKLRVRFVTAAGASHEEHFAEKDILNPTVLSQLMDRLGGVKVD